MKVLSPRAHAPLDYLAVVVLALAPFALGLGTLAASLSYGLAIALLALSLLTRYSLGVLRTVPLRIHGWIELGVGIVAIGAPFALGIGGSARVFFAIVGALLVVLHVITDHHGAEALLLPKPRSERSARPHLANREMI